MQHQPQQQLPGAAVGGARGGAYADTMQMLMGPGVGQFNLQAVSPWASLCLFHGDTLALLSVAILRLRLHGAMVPTVHPACLHPHKHVF